MKSLEAMYFHRQRLITGLYGLLFCLSLTRAQDTLPQTIFSLPNFSSQKPCAQACFTTGPIGGCFQDMVGDALGCVNDNECGLGSRGLAPNNCYCRTDFQSIAESFLTSCVKSGCTVGDSSIDISSAGSIYIDYCSSQGFPVNVPASTTHNPQATTTVASPSLQRTSPTNSGDSSAAPVPSSSSTTDTNSIAIGVGLGVGIPAIVVAILAWCFPCGHRRARLK
ncbi:uncharacterized protein K444DRAFT_671109 [Hyaloscypha bicolor E]|uniref:Extracellular membrane protein CFEM domain-containing protein n=1 Tax=Hyaloscypha bicolor E TaxID=1095630 RepID=A0A2J6SEC0_9HELO|nr:uncharacterized protein K444DRAFT_671109 [Hyaloscypha bicolor E]PMD49106.1 hypothetical protein K444DRAFT_671109 [Hyaloscypha bicolor E]